VVTKSQAQRNRFQKLGAGRSVSVDAKVGRQRFAVFLAVFAGGALLTYLTFMNTRDDRRRDQMIQFEQQVAQMAASVQTNLDLPFEILHSVTSFFAASEYVSRSDFRTFVRPALERHQAVYAFMWLPRVPEGERESFEAMVRAEGFADFAVKEVDGKPAAKRSEYFPIYYVEPPISIGTGIDIAAHPVQGPYVLRACSSDQAVASHLSIIEDPPEVVSTIAVMPVHLASAPTGAPCDGVTELILRIHPVLVEALGVRNLEKFRVVLSDPGAAPERQILYKNFPGDPGSLGSSRGLTDSRRIHFADQEWSLQVSPVPGTALAPGGPPWLIVVVGLVLSALAAHGLSAMVVIGGLRHEVEEALEYGQYKLGRELGSGGMGTVYEATHSMLARPAAIKIISPAAMGIGSDASSGMTDSMIGRFELEAKATALLESPHTIGIYDFGKTEDGSFYYVMELLRGVDLDALVKQHGPLPPARCIHLLRQVCSSLAEAHERGLTHRDIKPANIFVCRHALECDFAKVLDFGLVKTDTYGGDSVALTQTGTVIGTPAFMAPEMIQGESVDQRADIYSVGCVAYWMLTGALVFEADSPVNMMVKHISAEVPALSLRTELEIPPDLEQLVMQCLAKRPDERPESASKLACKLAECKTSREWTTDDAHAWWSQHMPSATSGSDPDAIGIFDSDPR